MKQIISVIVALLSINYSVANNIVYMNSDKNCHKNCNQDNHKKTNQNCYKNCNNNHSNYNIIFTNTDIDIYKSIIQDYITNNCSTNNCGTNNCNINNCGTNYCNTNNNSKKNNHTNNCNTNSSKSLSQILIEIAKQRLNTPYVAGTLDKNPDTENLIINLHETDCILFVESCLALALTAKSNDTSITNFINFIKNLRYKDGVVDGYTSRIHYTSEWILQGEANGFFKDISKELSGIPINNPISFISNHSDKYEHLKKYSADIQKIKTTEENINAKTFYYIPKNKVPNIINKLKNGDIVCFNTSIKGLDISHVGIIYINNGITTFIHASSMAQKTIIEKKSLIEYINGIKSNNGIRILRPL